MIPDESCTLIGPSLLLNEAVVGNRVPLACTFARFGSPTDPTAITLRIKSPTGTTTTYTFGTDVVVVRDGAGKYSFELTLSAAGTWRYRWVGTGDVTAAAERVVLALASKFNPP